MLSVLRTNTAGLVWWQRFLSGPLVKEVATVADQLANGSLAILRSNRYE